MTILKKILESIGINTISLSLTLHNDINQSEINNEIIKILGADVLLSNKKMIFNEFIETSTSHNFYINQVKNRFFTSQEILFLTMLKFRKIENFISQLNDVSCICDVLFMRYRFTNEFLSNFFNLEKSTTCKTYDPDANIEFLEETLKLPFGYLSKSIENLDIIKLDKCIEDFKKRNSNCFIDLSIKNKISVILFICMITKISVNQILFLMETTREYLWIISLILRGCGENFFSIHQNVYYAVNNKQLLHNKKEYENLIFCFLSKFNKKIHLPINMLTSDIGEIGDFQKFIKHIKNHKNILRG